ncbi:MAG: phosphonate ABC transporter, permease protein PhnE, partial [FCB group bacterium]|nr:phosphonate ABC transporter, permease protein PhnE [FCB group bacterium]
MKKENKFKLNLQAILTDLLFWIYIFGCVSFLLNHWFEVVIPGLQIVIYSAVVGVIVMICGISVGRKVFLSTKRTSNKWYKTFWGWSIVLILLITFIVGWILVEVNPYKFFTKFKNAGGIMSGIFDPNLDILIVSLT